MSIVGRPIWRRDSVVPVKLDLLTPGIEVGPVTGQRNFTVGVNKLRAVAEAFEASDYDIGEPLTEFAPVPGMGAMFVVDPDGNLTELSGAL